MSGDKAETVIVMICMQPTVFSVLPAIIFLKIRYRDII